MKILVEDQEKSNKGYIYIYKVKLSLELSIIKIIYERKSFIMVDN